MVQINVKATARGRVAGLVKDLSKAPGAIAVEEVFPGHEDEELARMLVADVEDEHVLTFLSFCAISFDVEEAERCASKRLLLPVKEK